MNFLNIKIHLELLQCSLYLEKHCSNFKEYLEKFWIWRICWRVNSGWTVEFSLQKNRYRLSIGDAKPGHNSYKPILVQFLFSNFKCKLMFVSPAFDIRSHSHAFASIAWTTSLSFLVVFASIASLVNLSHTIGAVVRPRGHVFLSNYLKNLQAWLESCIKIHPIYMMVS